MKRFIQNTIIAGLALLSLPAMADSFTAVQSGDWTATATWGGPAPSFNNLVDDITIPSGIVVNLDGDLELNGLLAQLNVIGTVETQNGSSIVIQQGLLSGSGMIDVDRIVFQTATSSNFTGSLMANVLLTNNFSLYIDGNSHINDSIIINGSSIALMSGDTLTIGTGGVVWAEDGAVTGQGTFTGDGMYEVYYGGNGLNTGLELTSEYVNNVTISMDATNDAVALDADANVHGKLLIAQGVLDLNGQALTLTGDFQSTANSMIRSDDQSELWIETATSLTSSLTFDANNNDIERIVIKLHADGEASFDSDVRVVAELRLVNGNAAVESGNMISFASNATIWRNAGMIDLNGSASSLNEGNVHLIYTGMSKATGVEAMSGAVANFSLDLLEDSQELTLLTDIWINDTAWFNIGSTRLNGFDLAFGGYAMSNSGIRLAGQSNSMLMISGMLAENTQFSFQEDDSLSAFVVDLDESNQFWINGNLNVRDSIALYRGMPTMTSTDVRLMANGMLYGGSEDAYLITEGSGRFKQTIEGDNQANVNFPLGDVDGYAPIRIKNAETNNGEFGVNLTSVVFANGTTGYDLSNSEEVVNKTWDITADANITVDLTLETEWTQEMEVNGFDRTEAYISHYMNSEWDVYAEAEAQATTSGSFTLTRSGVESLSPFSVQNEGAATTIDERVSEEIKLYPNPTFDHAFLQFNKNKVDMIHVYDMNGRRIKTMNVSNQSGKLTLDLSDLNRGTYILNLMSNDQIIASRELLKQ